MVGKRKIENKGEHGCLTYIYLGFLQWFLCTVRFMLEPELKLWSFVSVQLSSHYISLHYKYGPFVQ